MRRYLSVVFLAVYVASVESSCPLPKQYYVDCTAGRSLSSSVQLCLRYGMTMLNLTNSSHLMGDMFVLNETLRAVNCTSNFWFSSGNQTGIVASLDGLGAVLTTLLTGVGNLLGGVLTLVLNPLCLLGLCPATTTPAPITSARTICTRQVQQRVIQKCLTQSMRTDMKTYQFVEQPMYGGVLDTFSSRSRMACSGVCSTNDDCIGISYADGVCNLYM